jgi:hypothetical protein
MKNKIAKFLTKGLLLTFICSTVLTIIAVHIFYNEEASGHEGGLIFVLDLYCIAALLVLTICSATVYLNLQEKVRNNSQNLFLSFFSTPLLFILALFAKSTAADIWQVHTIIFFSFLLIHTIHYLKFKKVSFQ